jgi:hypothetical protein
VRRKSFEKRSKTPRKEEEEGKSRKEIEKMQFDFKVFIHKDFIKEGATAES